MSNYFSHIVARESNGFIGKEGGIPWSCPQDLALFKKYTLGKIVVMGRKTFESIGFLLPQRFSVVISRSHEIIYKEKKLPSLKEHPYFQNPTEPFPTEAVCHHNLQETLRFLREFSVPSKISQEIMIIGGGSIYKDTLQEVKKIYVSEIQTSISQGDTFYPPIPPGFQKIYTQDFPQSKPSFDFHIWEKE